MDQEIRQLGQECVEFFQQVKGNQAGDYLAVFSKQNRLKGNFNEISQWWNGYKPATPEDRAAKVEALRILASLDNAWFAFDTSRPLDFTLLDAEFKKGVGLSTPVEQQPRKKSTKDEINALSRGQEGLAEKLKKEGLSNGNIALELRKYSPEISPGRLGRLIQPEPKVGNDAYRKRGDKFLKEGKNE